MIMVFSRRLSDVLNGFIWGVGSGCFAFGVGFLLGKITLCGYSVALITP